VASEILTLSVVVFCVVTACRPVGDYWLLPEVGADMFLQKVLNIFCIVLETEFELYF
jgi:hypothetical protein